MQRGSSGAPKGGCPPPRKGRSPPSPPPPLLFPEVEQGFSSAASAVFCFVRLVGRGVKEQEEERKVRGLVLVARFGFREKRKSTPGKKKKRQKHSTHRQLRPQVVEQNGHGYGSGRVKVAQQPLGLAFLLLWREKKERGKREKREVR